MKLLAEGRDRRVFALDDARVLCRYREPRCTPREVAVIALDAGPVTRWLTGLGRRAFARMFLGCFVRGPVVAGAAR